MMQHSAATGRIMSVIHRNPLTDGIERIDHEWQGGDTAVINHEVAFDVPDDLTIGSVFILGHLRLRVIDVNLWMGTYIVMRDGYRARETILRSRLLRTLDTIYRRLIITLAVWGLARRGLLSDAASFDPYRQPTWRDVIALRRFAAWFDARRQRPD